MSDTSLSSELDLLSLSQNRRTTAIGLWLMVLVGIGIGVAAFFLLGFHHVLPPGRVDWLMRPSKDIPYYDPSTEFLGWHFFRRAPWTFPLGLNRSYGIEFGVSVVYSDSIPLLAILFKPFSPWMGTNFQYIGIWVLICFMMQGLFGALLASVFTTRLELKAIVATFFALSPILLERGLTEYPLMGHWLILWALYLYFLERRGGIRWVWMVIALLAAGTSFYFLPMVLLIWAADAVKTAIWRKESIGRLAIEGAGIVATALLTMWTVGYFCIKVSDAGTAEFGRFGTNLLGPLDSHGRSLFITAQAHGPHWLGEGYCYLGFGIILLTVAAVHELMRGPTLDKRLLRVLPLIVVLVGLAIFSLSNEVALGSHEVGYPNIWGPIGRMFRASSRMCWPGYYAAWLAIFYLTTRSLKRWPALILLGTMLVFQLVDYSYVYADMNDRYSNTEPWRTPLVSPFWNLAVQKYRRIIVVPSGEQYPYVPIAYFAANHNLPTNGVYVSRYPSSKVIGPISDHRLNALLQNQPNPDNLYIVPDPYRFAELVSHLGNAHGVGMIDGYHVIAPNWIADHEPADGLMPGGKN
jgi:Family of unknown function (DUF6311)